MIAGLRHWIDWLFDPHRDHSPALGALLREHEELLNGQRLAMGGPTAEQLGRPVVDMLTGRRHGGIGAFERAPDPDATPAAFTDCFVYDGPAMGQRPAMAQRLTITLPLDLAAWIDAERGTATREEFALGRLYIAKIVGDLQHADIRSMQEAMRTHGVAAALRKDAK